MNPQSGPSIGLENDASPSRVKDEDLVVQARAHDPSAIEELVHRYQQKAYVVAFHLSDENEQDAEDLTQEAFLRAFQLKALHGMSIQEIARIMGTAEGTVKSHLFRATHFLREKFKDWEEA